MAPLIKKEPIIAVGLIEDVPEVSFELLGEFHLENIGLKPGAYRVFCEGELLCLSLADGAILHRASSLHLTPSVPENALFALREVKIGKLFHWERSLVQKFKGALHVMMPSPGRITAINSIYLETYLASVIASEMSPENRIEFLKAHCICSRSWLLNQLGRKDTEQTTGHKADYSSSEIVFWTGREAHRDFDVCADDHCQRYQGLGRINTAAEQAMKETRGQVLVYDNEICDARYSKCCGGITEKFSVAWDDTPISYLESTADAQEPSPPVMSEEDARQFIISRPPAYCNIEDKTVIRKILPDFDCETRDFFRWRIDLPQKELQSLLLSKTGVDFGEIRELVPLERGPSGRLFKIKVRGTRQEKIIGKELEIRRILSSTHLLSSAFIVEPYGKAADVPAGFSLQGAGWGHGVGLCQIGAAGMAEQGRACEEILSHYFRGAQLTTLY
jgi:peptidoglycan hydrolase-like amidase